MKYKYLIVGASGSGKSTIAELLDKKYGLKQLISYTTRQPRYDGENTHIFVDKIEFDKLKDKIAYTEFDGNEYCATKEQLDNSDIYIIDPKGVEFLKEKYNNDVLRVIFIKACGSVRYERMKARLLENSNIEHTQAVNLSLHRIVNDVVEFYDYEHGFAAIDFVFRNENDDADYAAREVYKYIMANEIGVKYGGSYYNCDSDSLDNNTDDSDNSDNNNN